MAKNEVPVFPLNYAVWFEHVSGANEKLSQAIKSKISSGEVISEDVTVGLYQKYLAPPNQGEAEAAQRTVQKIIQAMNASIEQADQEVGKFDESLQACATQLNADMSADDLKQVVDGLLESTRDMHQGTQDLHRHLEESRKEAEQLKEELQKARIEATTDALTGLANRKGFEEKLKELEGDEEYLNQSHALIIGDIDKFKSINDTYGHIFGDKIIKVVAKAFSNLTKGKDLAARFGGEEFVILLPDTAIEGAVALAESIRSSIERGRVYNPKNGEEIRRITISLGVTEISHGESIDETIARADEALYRAKEGGRNQTQSNPAPIGLAAAS